MLVTIDGLNRGTRTTQYGEKATIGILVLEETVTDINDNTVKVDGRWLNGWGNKITDTWEKGMKVSVQITEEAGKKDPSRKFLNFKANPDYKPAPVEKSEEKTIDISVDPDDF